MRRKRNLKNPTLDVDTVAKWLTIIAIIAGISTFLTVVFNGAISRFCNGKNGYGNRWHVVHML